MPPLPFRLTVRQWLAVAILAAGAALRLMALDAEYFWWDEQFSADVANQSPARLIQLVAKDAHPPLFYLGLHYYQKLFPHPTIFALRLFPVLWGIVGLVVLYALGRRFVSEPAALWATALAAVSSFLIDYSQELRTYTMVVALTLAGSYCLLMGLHATRRRRTYFLLYALIAVLGLFSHYHTAFYLLSQGIFVTGWCWRQRQWEPLGEWVFAMALAGFMYGLWLPFQINQFFNAYIHWLPPLTFEMAGLFPLTYVALWGIHHRFVSLSIPIAVVLGIVLAVLWWAGRRPGGAPGKKSTAAAALWLMAATSIGPIIMVSVVSLTVQNLFYPRYLIFTAPGFILLAGFALTQMRARWAAAAFALVALINLSLVVDGFATRRKDDWRITFDYAVSEMGPEAVFIFHSDAIYEAFCRHTKTKPPRILFHESLPILEQIAAESPSPNVVMTFYQFMMAEDEFPLVLVRSLAESKQIDKTRALSLALCRNVRLGEYFDHQRAMRRDMDAAYTQWWLPSDPTFDRSFHQLEVDGSKNLFRWSQGTRGSLEWPVDLTPGDYEIQWQINTWRPDNAPPFRMNVAANGQPWPASVESRGSQTLTGRLRINPGDTRLRLDYEVTTWQPANCVRGSNDERDLGFMIYWIAVKFLE